MSAARAALFAFVLATSPSFADAQLVAIRAGRIVDPETGTIATDQVILVEGSIIKAVGKIAIPSGATVIDLSSATVLPGLFDAHTHLCLTNNAKRDNGNFFMTTVMDPTPYRAIQGVANARAMLESGFTTVRDVGNAGNYADSDLRRAIDEGIIPGPTILNSGRIISPYGGQFQLQPERRDLQFPEYIFADTRDELRKAIRENIHYGAKLIKIVVDDKPYIYSTEDIRFVVEESRLAGMKVAAHAWTHAGAHNAAEAGVASIEHGYEMTDEDLTLAKQNHVVLVGTDFTDAGARASGHPEWHAVFVDRLRRANRIGEPMAFGTDIAFDIPGETRGTLAIGNIDSFVEAGVPASTILQTLTVNAAHLLGVEKQRGAIRPGLAADIIAVNDNPLANIQTLKRVIFVMKNGRVFKSARPVT